MEHNPNMIPGFADQQERGAARKRLMLLRAVMILLPLVASLVIDMTGHFTYLRSALFLLPLLELRN